MSEPDDYIDKEALAKLREPFPPEAISKLPKGREDKSKRAKCRTCGGFHDPAMFHLDYVGHAALTDRLLNVDLGWSWQPMALDEHGAPILERNAQSQPVGLWIYLTVAGMTRPGYGSVEPGKPEAIKELIGDALRNAGMRFGMALDLWHKGDLPAHDEDEPSSATPTPAPEAVEAEEPAAGEPSAPGDSPAATPTKKKKVSPKRGALNKAFHAKLGQMGIDYEGEARHALMKAYDGKTLSELSDDDLKRLLDRLDDPAAEERFRILCRTATEEATAA